MDFVLLTYPQYKAEPVHWLVAGMLQALVEGQLPKKKLMVFAPPQIGKSELVSKRLPAWVLGREPDWPVLLASYGADLAVSHAESARGTVQMDVYGQVFPGVRLRKGRMALDLWQLGAGKRGSMRSVGTGGGITGHGGMLGIIDDPVKDWEQAQSEAARKKDWDWVLSTWGTRLWEGAYEVLVMTRWHEEDMAGMFLREQGDDWMVLRLPALAETQEERDKNNVYLGLAEGLPDPLGRGPGESLCPGRFSEKFYEKKRRAMGTVKWASLYCGVPRPLEGGRLKKAMFRYMEQLPDKPILRGRYWDNASSEGRGGSQTAGVRIAILPDRRVVVEDVVVGRWPESVDRNREIQKTALADREECGWVLVWVEQEPGSSGKDAVNEIIRVYLQGIVAEADKVTGNKDVRFDPFAAQVEQHNVYLLRAGWNEQFLEQVCNVPNMADRDIADATSGCYNKLSGLLLEQRRQKTTVRMKRG